jgi:hypothetical protein
MNLGKKIVILGGGPAGIEAALYARNLGHEPVVYERNEVGSHVLRWGFLRLFTPWRLNVSPLGRAELARQGRPLSVPDAFPTGREFVREYLRPLAEGLSLPWEGRMGRPVVHEGVEVVAVTRCGLLKGDNIGGRRRASAPFRILLRRQGEEREETAHTVIDATGVYATPCDLGDGGIPALGESALRSPGSETPIRYHLPDVLGEHRGEYAGRSVLLVGAGFSAASTLLDLNQLAREEPGTRIFWARRSSGPDPFPVYTDDPLPERARLAREGNRIASDPPAGCEVLCGVAVRAVSREGEALKVEFRGVDGGDFPQPIVVDRIVAQVGYRPDPALTRELQIHQCYASDGPMALAAALLARGGGGGDCLQQTSQGAETLRNPEPGYFIIGHKSFGRRNDYLLRLGLDQVRDVFRLISDDPALDLYAEEADRGKRSGPPAEAPAR